MDKVLTQGNWLKTLFYLKLLPITVLTTYSNPNKMLTTREINAAVINISGRQRMLCQRAALFALRLVCTQNPVEQEKLYQEMERTIDLMETSHNGLINGNVEMKLPGQPSETVGAIYFGAPLYLDHQIRDYIAQVRVLARTVSSKADASGVDSPIAENFNVAVKEAEPRVWACRRITRSHPTQLTQENPHLQAILKASTTDLIDALDIVVNQYQKESDAAALVLERQQAELYQQSCAATAATRAYAQQLEQTLQDLRCTQEQLIQTEKLSNIGQMVAGVAHEINNPVSFIYGNLRYASNYVQDLVELLNLYQEYYTNPIPAIQAKIKDIDLDFLLQDLPKVLASMEVGAERVRQLVLSLRNFSRSDRILMQSPNLHEGIDSTLLILQNRLKARGDRPAIEVVKEYGELPSFECCAGQLNQVFMNLLSNALDAMEDIPHHAGCLTIRTRINSGCSGIIIQIADNGPGMTPEVKAQLFDPFFTTKPRGKGTGLGLSISHQIVVEKHGGILKCESAPGKGTEFWIEIPLQPRLGLGVSESKVVAFSSAES